MVPVGEAERGRTSREGEQVTYGVNRDGDVEPVPAGGIDLSDRVNGMWFSNGEHEEDFFVRVVDKYPQMGDTHIEGRRVVEVSIELWIQMLADRAFYPVDPATGEQAAHD